MSGNDLWTALDEWDSRATKDGSDPAPESAPADDFLGTGMSVEAIAEGSGPMAAIAKELLELREVRAANAERERLALEAEAAVASGEVDFDSPEGLATLTILAEQKRLAEAESWRRLMRATLAQEHGADNAEAINAAMAQEELLYAQAEALMGPAGPTDIDAYRLHQRSKIEKAKAEQAALLTLERISAADPMAGLTASFDEAEGGVIEAVKKVLA